MFIEKIKSDGLAHLSYLVGDGAYACVIDPRRDCEVYVEKARQRGANITHVIETHRNEDLISGAPILAKLTGAEVFHGPNPDGKVEYAKTVREGDEFTIGAMVLRILETPGHTYDSISIQVRDKDFPDRAVGVFTGDALFVGDVGRTDFYPDEAEKVAGLLYDSLQKLLALGDQTIIYPAHGAGSVCGNNMAAREFSTIGHERRNNTMLQIPSREDFIQKKLDEHHYIPPYFKEMEHLNLVGGTPVADILIPRPLRPSDIESLSADWIIDVRSITSFGGAHILGSIAMPEGMISAFAGYFLTQDQSLVLICDDNKQATRSSMHLARMGYDKVLGRLDGLVGLSTTGARLESLEFVEAETVHERLTRKADDWELLDVRSVDEYEGECIKNAQHIYLGELPNFINKLEPKKHYTVMCGSGARATIAASYLMANKFANVDVFLGSMGAWKATDHKTE